MFIFPVIVCPEVMAAPVNGTLVISMPSSAQPLGVGTTATYSCDPGYVLVGDVTRTCEDSSTGSCAVGSWSGSEVDPLCKFFLPESKGIFIITVYNSSLEHFWCPPWEG